MDEFQLIEQLRDMWCGRKTYTNDEEWLDNVEQCIRELSEHNGLDFQSVMTEES